jgi:hypothetical protein
MFSMLVWIVLDIAAMALVFPNIIENLSPEPVFVNV